MSLSTDIVKFSQIMSSWIANTQELFFSNEGKDVTIKMLNEAGEVEDVLVPNYKKMNDMFITWKNSLNVKNTDGTLFSEDDTPLNVELFGGLTIGEYRDMFQSYIDDNRVKLIPIGTTTNMQPYHSIAFVTRSNKIKFVGLNNGAVYNYSGTANAGCTIELSQPFEKKDNKIVKIWNCGFHIVILYDDGSLYGRGIQSEGHFGIGNTAIVYRFVLIATDVVDYISASHGDQDEQPSAKILKTDGSVWASGDNGHGECGVGTTTNLYTWTKCYDPVVYGGDKAVQVYIEGDDVAYSMIVTENGKLWVAGYNGYGQLGVGDVVQRNSFVNVSPSIFDSAVKKIALGGYTDAHYGGTTLVLTTNGRVYSTGFNDYGQCSSNNTTQKNSFSEIVYDSSHNVATDKVVDILSVHRSSYILTESGKLYSCGLNNYGQLGLGHFTAQSRMKYVTNNVKNIYCSIGSDATDYPTIFITKTTGELMSCGYNGHGECGVGTTVNPNTFVVVPFSLSHKIVDICCGGYSADCTTYLLLDDGTVYGCGYNGYGQITGVNIGTAYISHFTQLKL